MMNGIPPASMEVLTAEAASNERSDPGPSRVGLVSDEQVESGSTGSWRGRRQSKDAIAQEKMGGGAG